MNDERFGFLAVWDPVLRFLHWWNAGMMTAMVLTGAVFVIAGHDMKEEAEATLATVHALFGFLLGAGLFARVLWLFMGPPTARWTDMLPLSAGRKKVFRGTIGYYIRGLRGELPLYFGHNALAGAAYLAFFAVACTQIISGALFLGLPEALRGKSLSHEVHELGFLLILLFMAAHLAAVFVHEVRERHGLISAMVHGRKTFTEGERELLSEDFPEAAKGDNGWPER